MKIFIEWIATGATANFEEDDSIIGPQTTFLEVKGFIRMRYGFRPQQLLLVCNQTLAEDDESLKKYGIVDSATAQAMPIGCHVFSLEEAAQEEQDMQAELEAEGKLEEERKKKKQQQQQQAAVAAEESSSPKKEQESQEKTDAEAAVPASEEAEKKTAGAVQGADKVDAASVANNNNSGKKKSTVLEFTFDDYQKALKILGRDKTTVSAARLASMQGDAVPRHRPKFLDEAKSRKEQEAKEALQRKVAADRAAGKLPSSGAVDSNSAAADAASADWTGREAQALRRIFKLGLYGCRRREADAAFSIDYPDYQGDGPLELWDVREDIMALISPDADRQPIVVELFYLAETDKGVNLDKLGAMVQARLEEHGLRIKVMATREAGCTYPLVACQCTGATPADLRQLGEVFFEEFGDEQHGMPEASKGGEHHHHGNNYDVGDDDYQGVDDGKNSWGAPPPRPGNPDQCVLQ